jgi:hypothetical protein
MISGPCQILVDPLVALQRFMNSTSEETIQTTDKHAGLVIRLYN